MQVVVTGADGFIGRRLSRALEDRRYTVRRVVRKAGGNPIAGTHAVGDISSATDWREVVAGAHAVVHLANRAHVLNDVSQDPLQEFRRVNVAGSIGLAEAAVRAEVRRYVFVSSIGVNGICTYDHPFTERDRPNPTEPYAVSKLEAELALAACSASSGMQLVIVRPPLVYGPGAKGNLLRLMKLVDAGLPMPLGSVRNQRSLVGVDNLSDLLVACVEQDKASGEVFLAADGEDISTPDILRLIARVSRRSARLLPCPIGVLRLLASAAGARKELDRLIGSLQVDASHARSILGWRPRVSLEDGIREMVGSYHAPATGEKRA